MCKSKFSIGICLTFVILIFTFPNISAAEIKVYDDTNQYLGILLDMEGQTTLTVFIPSINVAYRVEKWKLEDPDSCTLNEILIFESNDCSGIPYTSGPFPYVLNLAIPPYDGYYIADSNRGKLFAPKSQLLCDPMTGSVVCRQTPEMPSTLFYEAKEIQLPFTTPISLPVRFDNVAGTSEFYVIPVKKK